MTFNPYVASEELAGWGNLVSPLDAGAINANLKDADPAVYALLEFAKVVIGHHAGERWESTAAATGLNVNPVEQSIGGINPLFFFLEAQFQFPLLTIHRERKKTREWSSDTLLKDSTLHLSWILPPLDIRQAAAITPFLNSVSDALETELYRNASWLRSEAGISELEIQETVFRSVEQDAQESQIYFPGFVMTITATEVQTFPDSGLVLPLLSVSTQLDNGDEEPELVQNDFITNLENQ